MIDGDPLVNHDGPGLDRKNEQQHIDGGEPEAGEHLEELQPVQPRADDGVSTLQGVDDTPRGKIGGGCRGKDGAAFHFVTLPVAGRAALQPPAAQEVAPALVCACPLSQRKMKMHLCSHHDS
jgi:hypothetical protein